VHAIYGVLVKGGGMLQEVAYGGVINVNVGYGGEENVAGCGVERCTDIWTPYAGVWPVSAKAHFVRQVVVLGLSEVR